MPTCLIEAGEVDSRGADTPVAELLHVPEEDAQRLIIECVAGTSGSKQPGLAIHSSAASDMPVAACAACGASAVPADLPMPAASPSAGIREHEAKAQMTPFTNREPIADEEPVQPDQRRMRGSTGRWAML